ncbi:hypothetical protein Zm00014a_044163 [Zea mays]|uniref:Uncharacterized protein n=1 Tax=Zea mays TaxID=4577 RepID=A0A3L6EER3_MAIZE|nr:hypothetical protein Zm00014a_044163 [Zea mays]
MSINRSAPLLHLAIFHHHPSLFPSRHQPSSPRRRPPLCSPHGSKHGAWLLSPW